MSVWKDCSGSRVWVSGHDVSDHFPMQVGQPEISPGVVVGEFLVIEAQQRQQRGVELSLIHI